MLRTLLAALLFVAAPLAASAGDHAYHYEKIKAYKTVTEYVVKQETYTKQITIYDAYGKPRTQTITETRDVKTPIQRQVPYEKWVKVYDN